MESVRIKVLRSIGGIRFGDMNRKGYTVFSEYSLIIFNVHFFVWVQKRTDRSLSFRFETMG